MLLTPGATGPSALSAQLASALPPLPAATQLQDNTLALLHHMALATGTHAAFILTPGTTHAATGHQEGGSRGTPVEVSEWLHMDRGLFVPCHSLVPCASPPPKLYYPRTHRTEAGTKVLSSLPLTPFPPLRPPRRRIPPHRRLNGRVRVARGRCGARRGADVRHAAGWGGRQRVGGGGPWEVGGAELAKSLVLT